MYRQFFLHTSCFFNLVTIDRATLMRCVPNASQLKKDLWRMKNIKHSGSTPITPITFSPFEVVSSKSYDNWLPENFHKIDICLMILFTVHTFLSGMKRWVSWWELSDFIYQLMVGPIGLKSNAMENSLWIFIVFVVQLLLDEMFMTLGMVSCQTFI